MKEFNIVIDYDEKIEMLTIYDVDSEEQKIISNVKSISDVSVCITDYLKERN